MDSANRNRISAANWIGLALYQAGWIAVMLVAQAVARRHGFGFRTLSQDVAPQAELPYFAGYVSHLGAMLWCVAGAVCLFCYAAARRRLERTWVGFFLAAGLLSMLLMADDLFLLHEEVFRRLSGLDERVIFGIYGLFMLAFLARYVKLLRNQWTPLLVMSLVMFAASLIVDVGVIRVAEDRRHLAEDGTKFLGAANWCAFLVLTAWSRLSAALEGHGTSAA